jgi:hypothetical protein
MIDPKDDKQVVQVYDYVDIHVPTLMRMYKKRVKGYEAIGYSMQSGHENPVKQNMNTSIFKLMKSKEMGNF